MANSVESIERDDAPRPDARAEPQSVAVVATTAAARDYANAVPQHKGKEASVEAVFKLYNTYVYPGQKVLGAMDPERLAAVQKFYVKEGIVAKETPIAELYTNQFVQ